MHGAAYKNTDTWNYFLMLFIILLFFSTIIVIIVYIKRVKSIEAFLL